METQKRASLGCYILLLLVALVTAKRYCFQSFVRRGSVAVCFLPQLLFCLFSCLLYPFWTSRSEIRFCVQLLTPQSRPELGIYLVISLYGSRPVCLSSLAMARRLARFLWVAGLRPSPYQYWFSQVNSCSSAMESRYISHGRTGGRWRHQPTRREPGPLVIFYFHFFVLA